VLGDSDVSRGRRQRGRSRSIVGPDLDSTGSGVSSPSDSDSSALRHAEWLLPRPAAAHRHRHDHHKHTAKSPVERQVLRRIAGQPAAAEPPHGTDEQDVGRAQVDDAAQSADDQKITWYVEEAGAWPRDPPGGEASVAAAVEHDDDDDAERRGELPLPSSARRRRTASWPLSSADAARAARAKSRHCSRRPSPSTVVATAVVEPEPETHRVHRPDEADTYATDDSGVVDEQLLHVHPVHGERLLQVNGNYFRSTTSDYFR